MMPGLRAELDRLLSILVDDELSETEHSRLEELLRSDEECRRFYLEYVDLHVRLAHHPRLSALLESPPELSAVQPQTTPALTPSRPRWVPLMVTAALTLAASLVVQLFVSEPPPADPGAVGLTPPVASSPTIVPSYVATLSKNVACVWEGDEPLRSGMRLLPGVIRLRSGTAELQFDGGAQLVLACDLVVMADTAKLTEVFVRRGIMPDAGGVYLLPRIVGMHRAKELLFLGDSIDATSAERFGIANRVVEASELDTTVDALAQRFCTLPTKAIGLTKRLLNRSFESSREQSFDDEALFQELIVATDDTQEGLRAFSERRDPRFRGW